jgi:hypothetical protein
VAWFEDDPGRLREELRALEAAGLSFALNDAAREQRGVIEIEVTVDLKGAPQRVVATYPDEFPYFKPFVHGPDVGYAHHFNPATGEYCLLEAGRGVWVPSDTLAWLLTEQLGLVAAVNAPGVAPDDVSAREVAQAEPFSCYVPVGNPAEHVIVDGALDRVGATSGWARMVYTCADPLRGHVIELLEDAKATLSGPVRAPALPPAEQRLGAVLIPWVQLSELPKGTDVEAWWAAAAEIDPRFERVCQGVPGKASVAVAKAFQFVLIGFPEETAHRKLGQGWVVLVRSREKRNKPWRHARVIRVERAGHLDLFMREPRLRKMADAKILLAGLGGLGGPLANLLACMAPDRLMMIDGDIASPATAVRNPGAFAASGYPKVQAAVNAAYATQPYTELQGVGHMYGRPRLATGLAPGRGELSDEDADVAAMVAEVDLVVDSTADLGVQHYLSDVARRHGVAYLRTEALQGVWSGFIALQRPNADVCWMCWQHHLATTIPALPARPDDGVQPPGCGDPTYTGAGFDLATIAAQTARTAASYLTGKDGYGAMPSDVMTVQFRDSSGVPTLPVWQSHALERHSDCPNHR